MPLSLTMKSEQSIVGFLYAYKTSVAGEIPSVQHTEHGEILK